VIGYVTVFAIGLFVGAIAGVGVVALCLTRSERRTGLRISKESDAGDE
jgi:hypothetical protein